MIINLNISPLSYNSYYRNSKTGRRVKTGAGLAYDEELGLLLEDYAIALRDFGSIVNPSKNIVELDIVHYNTKYYTKLGRLSKTAGDWDNPIKVLQDKIFDLIGVDDYIIKRGHLTQVPSEVDAVRVEIRLRDHCGLFTADYFADW